MSLSLIVVALGAVVAAVGTGALTARCARGPRIYLVAWAIGVFGLAISLGAQTLGYLTSYSGLIFRAMELGAQVIAPLALCLGLVELVGKTVPARFAMRLAVSAIGVIAIVILGTDPLNPAVTFSKLWPDPAVCYELVPKALIEYLLSPFTALVAIITGLVMLWRLRRDQSAGDAVLPVTAAAGAALVLAVPGLALLLQHAGLTLSAAHRIFGPVCLLAAGLTWLAAERAARRGLGAARAGAGDARHAAADRVGADGYRASDRRHDQGTGTDSAYETGEYDGYGAGADQMGGRYERDDAGAEHASAGYDSAGYDRAGYDGAGYRSPGSGDEAHRAGNGQDVAAASPQLGVHDADGPYPALAALAAEAAVLPGGNGGYREEAGAGYGPPAKYGDPDRSGGRSGRQPPAGDDPHAHLLGQIAIYTLIEERIQDFDRLTEKVVAQVRAREPDTLVYIVHAVPTAPMQRILYEVYRDRAAHDEHQQRPYILRYEAERRPFVLATNVIELGLQQAKVSPLPSISDILTESGIDLTGVTRSPRGIAPPPTGDHPTPMPSAQPAEWLPAAVPPAPGQAGEPGYDRRYQGWTELRGEEPPYR